MHSMSMLSTTPVRGGMTAGFNYYRTLLDDARFLAAYADRKFAMPSLLLPGDTEFRTIYSRQ